MKDYRNIVKVILDDVKNDLSDEEILNMILEKPIAKSSARKDLTFAQRAADNLAKFAGSWTFIIAFSVVIFGWMGLNMWYLIQPFDPHPFILLNLVLSCIAAIQAPVILMSQNRQEAKDRERAENDYKVNLKVEIIIEDLHNRIKAIEKNQKDLIEKINTLLNRK